MPFLQTAVSSSLSRPLISPLTCPSPLHRTRYASLVSAWGRTALHEACQGGHVEVVELLHAAGLPIETSDQEGIGPLHTASLHGHVLAHASTRTRPSHSPQAPFRWHSPAPVQAFSSPIYPCPDLHPHAHPHPRHATLVAWLLCAGASVEASGMPNHHPQRLAPPRTHTLPHPSCSTLVLTPGN